MRRHLRRLKYRLWRFMDWAWCSRRDHWWRTFIDGGVCHYCRLCRTVEYDI